MAFRHPYDVDTFIAATTITGEIPSTHSTGVGSSSNRSLICTVGPLSSLAAHSRSFMVASPTPAAVTGSQHTFVTHCRDIPALLAMSAGRMSL
jgi:hypothetical protein